MRVILIALILLSWSTAAWAHKSSDSYLSLAVAGAGIAGKWDIALRDLDDALGLDDNSDGKLTWGEVKAHQPDIAAYALSHLGLTMDGAACPSQLQSFDIDQHSDGGYAVLHFAAACAQDGKQLGVAYSLFFDLDPQHRGLLNFSRNTLSETFAFSPGSRTFECTPGGGSDASAFVSYLREGIGHIWSGYDHMLFLLALLLPAVLQRTPTGWRPAPCFRSALIAVLKTVTAFTVAHSITLSCAALGVIALPSRWVESAIAVSVVVAAANNIFPVIKDRTWPVAFVFGLVHGLGFANVLFELGLPRGKLYLALFGFNVGVEIGQLVIVAIFLPIAYLLRPSSLYSRVVLTGGSACIVAIATVWFVERAFDLNLFGLLA